jgi:5-deoxy-glucuronate isomerase
MVPNTVHGPKPSSLNRGLTELISSRARPEVGLTFQIYRADPGEPVAFGSEGEETAVLVFSGSGEMRCKGRGLEFARRDWIRTPPTVGHCAAGDAIELLNTGDSSLEVFVIRTPNPARFSSRIFDAADIQEEHRGKGILDDTCHRLVRLVFDDNNSPPESLLVLGEVVNFPGKWSSYPPHFHAQPEIYYYRFEPSKGYGHAELGDDVFRISDGDLLVITDKRTHAQVSAPGYHMYYLWVIRHLAKNRYSGFTFDPRHAWTFGV